MYVSTSSVYMYEIQKHEFFFVCFFWQDYTWKAPEGQIYMYMYMPFCFPLQLQGGRGNLYDSSACHGHCIFLK